MENHTALKFSHHLFCVVWVWRLFTLLSHENLSATLLTDSLLCNNEGSLAPKALSFFFVFLLLLLLVVVYWSSANRVIATR